MLERNEREDGENGGERGGGVQKVEVLANGGIGGV